MMEFAVYIVDFSSAVRLVTAKQKQKPILVQQNKPVQLCFCSGRWTHQR